MAMDWISGSIPKPFEHTTTRIDNARVHCVIGGEGPTVVLVPGWPETWYAWHRIMPTLAENFRVVAVDPPGLGDSEPSTSGYDTASIARALREVVSRLGSTSYDVVGHDVGTWISYAWAAQFRGEVKRLVLLDAAIPGIGKAQTYPLPPEINLKAWQFSFNMLPDLPEALTSGREGVLLDWLFDQKAKHPEQLTRDDRAEYLRAYRRPGKMKAGFDYYRAVPQSTIQNHDFAKVTLTMPVLALGGETGTGRVLVDSLKAVATDVRGGVISDCGHYIAEERPEALLAELLAFLKRDGGAE